MSGSECSLCYRNMPMTNDKLREWYCKVLKVDTICDDCLNNIERSRREHMARKKIDQEVVINVSAKEG